MTFAPVTDGGPQQQLPRYKCHKTVWAIEIQGVIHDPGASVLLVPVEGSGFEPFAVSREYLEKHRPQPNGYYVKYEDGYESWSPKEVFEAGYKPL